MVKRYVIVQSAEAGDDGDMFHAVYAYEGEQGSRRTTPADKPKSVTGYVQTAGACVKASPQTVEAAFGKNGELQVKYSSCHAGTPEDFRQSVEHAAKTTYNNKSILQSAKGSLGVKVLGGIGAAMIGAGAIMQGFQNFHMVQAFGADGVWTQEEIVRFVYDNLQNMMSPAGGAVSDLVQDGIDKNATNVILDPSNISEDPGVVEELINTVVEHAGDFVKSLFGL